MPCRRILRFVNGQTGRQGYLDAKLGRRPSDRSETVLQEYFKKLTGTDDIWEVRIEFGNEIFRLLGFFDSGNLVILTNGFAKKTQKTPANEIVVATERKMDYLSRKK